MVDQYRGIKDPVLMTDRELAYYRDRVAQETERRLQTRLAGFSVVYYANDSRHRGAYDHPAQDTRVWDNPKELEAAAIIDGAPLWWRVLHLGKVSL